MTPASFVEILRGLDIESTFNPYSDCCEVYDRHEAPKHRRNALLAILEEATTQSVDSLWIARDLGYRGGRRTGLALTDDVHFSIHAERWGVHIKRPTRGEIIAERTATVIWNILNEIDATVFLWNVFPLHPHESNNPFTNRAHNARERSIGEELLEQLILMLKPRKLVPIGNDAAASTCRIQGEQDTFKVRHPSYGGQSIFLRQMRDLYNS